MIKIPNMIFQKLKRMNVSEFPQSPGIYIFRGKNGELLYIGKAANLRNRIRSYFKKLASENKQSFNRPIEQVIDRVTNVGIKKTDSVLEALILESHLIKKLQPKYNVMRKDDKDFCYFVITREKFPRVLILRKKDLFSRFLIRPFSFQKDTEAKIKGEFFGPYASKKQIETALKIIREIFPFHDLNQKTEKGCLDFELGRCPGPYVGAISEKDYAENIRGIRMILNGKKKSLTKRLEKEMQKCAASGDFERAAEVRNKIFALKHIQDVALISEDFSDLQFIENKNKKKRHAEKKFRIEAYDVSNISGQYSVGSMVVFKNNSPDNSQYRKFKIKNTTNSDDDIEMMKEVLIRRFKNSWPNPNFILLDGGDGHLNMAIDLLRDLNLDADIAAIAKGPKRKNLRVITHSSNLEFKKFLGDKKFIKRIMNEAHRFAICYHRKLREKSMLS